MVQAVEVARLWRWRGREDGSDYGDGVVQLEDCRTATMVFQVLVTVKDSPSLLDSIVEAVLICVLAIRTWVPVLFHYGVFDLLITRKRYSFLKTNASFVDTQLHLAYYGCLLDFLDVQYYSSLNKACAKDMYPFPEEGEELASLMGYPYKCFLRILNEYSQIRMAEDDEEKTGFHTEEKVYCFPHMPKDLKKLSSYTSEDDGEYLAHDVEETLRKLKRVNIKIDPVTSPFRVKEGRFLGYMVTKEGVKADQKKYSKFIPKLAELKYPICEARMRLETAKGPGWTNEAEEALQKIKRKLGILQTLVIQKEGEDLMLCLRKRNKTISSVLLVEREGIQIPVSYVSRPLQGMEICYTPTEKIGTNTNSHNKIPEKRKLKAVVKKFFGQGEQVERTPYANEGGTLTLSKKLQVKSTPVPRAWWLYLGKDTIKEGSGVGIILVSPEKKMHTYAIRLKFNASNHVMDCEALLARLVASANQGMKDLHVFIDSLTLVAKVPNHTPPKILNLKDEVLTGLETIKLEFLNQEVSVGIKTRPSVEETSSRNKDKTASNEPRAKPNYNREASGSN
ncbi:reverse transcriptase domain-containing protein [Tanacetum coccineum]